MVGVVESFAVAGAVAAMISAFKDGKMMFRAWRAKRKAAKDQNECDSVQGSLQKNSVAIERTYDNFHHQLGEVFGRGDAIARQQLQHSLEKFQRTMRECLTMALSHRLDQEVKMLYAQSENTAKATLDTLKDLYQRLRTTGTVPRNFHRQKASDNAFEPARIGEENWMPCANPGRLRWENNFQAPSSLQQRSGSDPYPYLAANTSVGLLRLGLDCIRRRSSTISLRGESSLVLQRNSITLSRTGL